MVIVELLNRGGWMMWVLAGLSIVAMAITLDRVLSLFIRSNLDVSKYLKNIVSLVESKDYTKAMEACNIRTSHPLPRVLKAGIAKSNRREKEIERSMETQMLRAIPGVQRGVGFLGLLGNTATLLGLLGTIFGLIKAFSGVSAASASARQQVLAEGISEAMYTTAFGLIVAVPILFAHQLISTKMDRVLLQIEEGASALLVALAGRLKDVGKG